MTSAKFERMWRFMKENEKCQPESNDISDDLKCTICKQVMINPHYGTCGCRFCLDCITAYLDGQQKWCPGDKDDCKEQLMGIDENVYFQAVANRIISRLPVKCPRQFCEFRCEWSKMEEHASSCEVHPVNCPYTIFGCNDVQLTNDKICEHLSTSTESHGHLMATGVDRLHKEIDSLKKDVVELRSEKAEQQRFTEQQARDIECLNEAMGQMKSELESEKRQDKKRSNLICQLMREMANWHSEKEERQCGHNAEMEYLKEAMRCMKTTLVDKESNEMQKNQVDEKVENLKTENQLIKAKNITMKAEIDKYRGEYLRLVKDTEKQLSEMRTQSQTQGREISQLKGNLIALVSMNDDDEDEQDDSEIGIDTGVSVISLNCANRDKFEWCVDNWAHKRDFTHMYGFPDRIFSDPFYTHKNGYKLCLSLSPKSWGAGKGTHLGVSFHLMQGPYDEYLSWPFKHDVTISLINQQTGEAHSIYNSTFDEHPRNACRKRPNWHHSKGIGLAQLINLNLLANNLKLCKDDKLIIHCQVKKN